MAFLGLLTLISFDESPNINIFSSSLGSFRPTIRHIMAEEMALCWARFRQKSEIGGISLSRCWSTHICYVTATFGRIMSLANSEKHGILF
jgi:hypothetical protein